MIHNIEPKLLTRAVKVILVGAGGTGSHVLRGLASMHHAMVALGHPAGLEVVVVDPDTVSSSNIGRQNFWLSDLGQPKAEVLVNRCNMMLGTNWHALQEKVMKTSRFNSPDLVIGCVDNRKGRDAILAATKRGLYGVQSSYYLDIGNANSSGQYVLGQVVATGVKRGNRLPHVADLIPEIIDATLDDKDDGPSCSMAEALARQSLFINSSMATAACSLLWELFRNGHITHHGQFINIKTGRASPLSIDPEAWKRFGYQDKKTQPKPKRSRKPAEAKVENNGQVLAV